MTPTAMVFTSLLAILILSLPRKYAVIPVLIGASYLTIGQFLLIGPFHFYLLRLLISVAWLRIIIKKEHEGFWFNSIDKTVLLWGVIAIVTGTFQDTSKMVPGLVNSLGWCFNTLGVYFIFRITIQESDDIKRTVKVLAIILIPLALSMLMEKQTGRNPFFFLGGVPEFSQIREGSLRAQGPFLHPILAGTAAVTAIPLLVSLWWNMDRGKIFAVLGIVSAMGITFACASSGPVLTLLVVLLSMAVWFLRDFLGLVRWGIVLGIIGLQLVMKAPFWHILGKIGNQTGGTGYHRSELIDSAIAHFNEWWLVGTTYTRHWMATGVTWSKDHTDITSQYIAQGVMGGALLLLVFFIIIIKCFLTIGRALKGLPDERLGDTILLWSMGAALVGHTVSFISVSYFDQTVVFYYLLIALISSSSFCFYEPPATDDDPAKER
ncbi:MAG: hypothetical protein JXA71_10155 [Chitinispirillaceae bacterium]|nr:hypothetical protein [Chitinispirillaceae bacterium]